MGWEQQGEPLGRKENENKDRFARYARQMQFKHIGERGQRELSKKKVLIVGMGALGTVSANHLVRAGVGGLRIVDRDYVEWSNLQRQLLYDEEDVREALPKSVAAERKLRRINGDVEIEAFVADVTAENAETFLDGIDLVMDGTDNFDTRFLLNDVCFYTGTPYIYGGIVGSRAMSAAFVPGETLCLRCLIAPPEGEVETCESVGILSPVSGITASLQAAEALKFLTGSPEALKRSVTYVDVWHNLFKEIAYGEPSSHCPVCSKKTYPALHPKREEAVQPVKMCGRNTVQLQHPAAFDLDAIEASLGSAVEFYRNPFLMKLYVEEDLTLVLFEDGRLLVQGTEDADQAVAVYKRHLHYLNQTRPISS